MYKRIIIIISLIIIITASSAYSIAIWPLSRRSDMLGYFAPCWGDNNKIYFIKEVTFGEKDLLLSKIFPLFGDYFVNKTEVYLCSMNYDGTEKKEIVKIGDTDKGTYWLPMYLDYCQANDLILLSGGVHPSRGESINGIYTIKTDGSDKKKISDVGMHASWSPDGKKMVYRMHVNKEKRREDGWLEGYEDYDSLWIMDADGNNKYKIFSGEKDEWIESPIWSPKGDLIAFVCKGWIWVMKPDGSERRRVCEGTICNWWIDGKMLLVEGGKLVDLNGNIVKRMKWALQVSPDGEFGVGGGFRVIKIGTGELVKDLFEDIKYPEHFVYKKPNNIW